MPADPQANQFLDGELCYGKSSVGGQNRRFIYIHCHKKTLTIVIPMSQIESMCPKSTTVMQHCVLKIVNQTQETRRPTTTTATPLAYMLTKGAPTMVPDE